MKAYLKTHVWGMQKETLGLWLGVLGVAIFAVTLPMTRLATGTVDAPQLSPWFVTFGRAALAGFLSIAVLLAVRAPWPTAAQRKPLLFAGQRHWLPAAAGLGAAPRHIGPCGGDHGAASAGHCSHGGMGTAPPGALGLLGMRRAGQRVGGGVFALTGLPNWAWGRAWLCAGMGRLATAHRRAGCLTRVCVWHAGDPRAGSRAGDLLGVRDGAAAYPARHGFDLAHAACGVVGLGGTALRGRVFYVGGLFCVVSWADAGRRAQGEPNATTATVSQHLGGSALAG